MNGTPGFGIPRLGMEARLSGRLVFRQLLLLFIIGTLYLGVLFFFDLYGRFDWDSLWGLPYISFRAISIPSILVLVYGYVLLIGLMFALTPSERSFQFFFYGILFVLFLANYDHSILDWFLIEIFSATIRVENLVSLPKILFIGPLLSCVILMHYNILADDFTRRMLRRGIPTEEVAKIRPGMMQALYPLLVVSCLVVAAFGLIAEFSDLVFGRHPLFPKAELLILGVLGVAIAFVLRSIIKEMWQSGEENENDSERGPNG